MVKKEKNKYIVSFVNDGKPFELTKWTVRKQNKVLSEMTKYEEKHEDLTETQKDEKYHNLLIKVGLSEFNPKITDEELDNMHPADKAALFTAIYYAGRKGIIYKKDKDDARNFPQK